MTPARAALPAVLLATVGLACGGDDAAAPCAGVDCNGHGTCYTDGVWPLCTCEPGWRPAGASCVPDGDAGDAPDDAAESGADADADGTTDGTPACDPAGGDDRCTDGTHFRCRPDGTGFDDESCAWGCDPTGRRCGELLLPNLTDPAILGAGTGSLFPPGLMAPYVVLDTDTGAITAHDEEGSLLASLRLPLSGLDPVTGIFFIVQAQDADSPGLGIFSMADLEIPAGLTVLGQGENALVLVASGDANVAGTLNVAARPTSWLSDSGPGGRPGGGASPPSAGSGPGGGAAGNEHASATIIDTGGGGAGHGGRGGRGGAVLPEPPGGAGGEPHGTAVLQPLQGGSGGGAGGDTGTRAGPGGAGGGAVALGAGGELVVTGTVYAGGGGGRGGRATSVLSQGSGGGGGAGGAILLQAPTVRISGTLAANGGGGGGGAQGATAGNPGENGAASAVAARGGTGGSPGENDGGAGGAADQPDGLDAAALDDGGFSVHTGGGGGAAGVIRINGRTLDLAGATLSPSVASVLATTGPLPTR